MIRTTASRLAFTTTLALGGLVASALVLAPAAPAAAKSFIAAPNGMVGVAEVITISAPSAAGQVVTIGLQTGTVAQTLQTTLGSNGLGSVNWTPTVAGTWTINTLGSIVSAGSTTTTVVPMSTYTVLLAQNSVQQGVSNNLLGAVIAPIGSIAPTGNLYLATTNGNGIVTSALTGLYGGTTATATLPWTPTAAGTASIQATYQPSSGSQTTSVSPVSTPNITSTVPTVALRWPATLYVGTPTVLQAVLGTTIPNGSVAFAMDGTGITGSMPTTNGVATLQWTPPVSGIHTISVSFTSNTPGFSGTSSQVVNIQPARVTDNITVDPPTQPVWSIAQPIIMNAGTSVTLAGTSASGTTVLFSEQGPCAIAGAVLQALSPGQCQVTAISPGNSALTPGSETYTVTVQAAPKPPKKPGR